MCTFIYVCVDYVYRTRKYYHYYYTLCKYGNSPGKNEPKKIYDG